MRHFLCVDLGTQQDYTAIADLERVERFRAKSSLPGTEAWEREKRVIISEYHLRLLERPDLGVKYPDVVDYLVTLMQTKELAKQTALLVDATGVGLPVIQWMREAGLEPIPIIITGGNTVSESTIGGFNVPKKELIAALQLIFQTRRLKIARGLKWEDQFKKELENFKLKISKAGNELMEAWREGDHDDIVLAVSLGAWYAEKLYGSKVIVERKTKRKKQDTLHYGLGATR